MPFHAGTLLGCAVVALLLMEGEASALSCGRRNLRLPRPDSVGVPTNARVWCSSAASERPQISVAARGGARISGTQTEIPLQGYASTQPPSDFALLLFHPDQELAPGTSYDVSCPALDGTSAVESFSFTTGFGPVDAAPELPDLSRLIVSSTSGFIYGDSSTASFERPAPPGTLVVIDVGGTATLDPRAATGSVADVELMSDVNDTVYVGWSPCGGNWREAAPGASTVLRLGAFAVTGAFSGWSAALTVTVPEPPLTPEPSDPAIAVGQPDTSSEGGGCATAGGTASRGAASSWAALACAAVAVGCRARRRR